MRQAPRWIPIALLLCCTAAMPGLAATIAPPYNLGEIARISQTTVLAEAVGSRTELRGQIPFTYTTFRVVRDVAGDKLGTTFKVETKGGVVGEIGYAAPGTPKFEQGGRYLLFLDRGAGDNWRLKMASYGVLRETTGTGLLAPVPEAAELDVLPRAGIEPVGAYREADLLTHLAAVKAGSPWHRQAAEVFQTEALQEKSADVAIAGAALQNVPPACQFITGTVDSQPIRWFGFETGGATGIWHTTPGQVGISDGGVAAVQQGAAAWSNHAASAINLNYLGSKASTANCADNIADVPGEVTFNDPCNQMAALGTCTNPGAGWTSSTCCGEVAQYGYLYNPSTALYDGSPWHPITGFSVVVNDGTQCLGETDFKEAITHFLGHGLGFNHHADPDATMYVNLGVHAPRGAALGTTDKVCASYAYHSFLDVPYNHFAWKFIEAVRANGVNDGCGSGNFCPSTVITRGIMAVFLLKSKEGAAYVPPPCTTPTFSDMPCSNPLAPWVEELVRRGVTAGCGGGQYCPDNPVTRAQVAVFLIKTVEGPSYVPPACVTPTFNDVPCSDPFAPWVKEIVDRGLTAGCGSGNYCPNVGLTRAQIAVFVSVNFGLPIPVP